MENSIYLGLSRQLALQTNMNIVANNIANMNTPGYRGQNLLFKEYISDPRGADDALSFVYNEGQYDITDPGPIRVTGSQLDIAVHGPGFIGVQDPTGEIAYSRAGNFHLSPDGALVNGAGLPVAGAGGGPINIPAGSTEINIDDRGFISNQGGQIGQIMIVEFANPQSLEPIGNTLYRSDQAGQPATNTTVKQGQVEGANVNAVVEMTRMIETLRAFQSTQQLLQTENERLRGAIQKLSRSN